MRFELSPEDAAQVLVAANELWPPGPSFRVDATRVLRALVPCDLVMFNRSDLETGATDFAVAPVELQPRIATTASLMVSTAHDHPIVIQYLGMGDPGPLRVSDVVSPEEWRSTDFYRHYMASLGMKHTIALIVPSADGYMNVLSLYSAQHDFTDRDLSVVEAFTPTLALGCGGAPTRSGPLPDVMAGWRMVSVAATGELLAVTPPDEDGALRPGLSLPAAALRAVRDGRYGEVVEIGLEDTFWQVQVLSGTPEALVVFARPVEAQRDAIHRLTPRRREVLELIAKGHTNARIGRELGIAEGTARKHVEQVLASLGAVNRAAAAGMWMAATE